ncbi:MAG: site-specific DNA-methyltransferase [Anaerolineales bacterium]|nr:MAG: site-specific DNA-methyltransferase [Anaerolineales bacterium]
MPTINWSSKSEKTPPEGGLITESILYQNPEVKEIASVENRLILGDNLRVMSALLEEYEGKIDLIYTDPPFFTNKDYAARVGRGEDSRKPEEWQLAEGYPDEWDDLDSYLDMLYPRLRLMHRLLSPTGSLYLHLDWHANSYARILLDEIFGYDNFRNEIIWTYHGPSPIRSAFNRKHDMILFYTKSDQYVFNTDQVRIPYASNTIDTFKSSKKAGFGKEPDLDRGKVPEDWWYFPVVARLHHERTGYPTQKPERLLERIILASSNPGDTVADFFGGAGTTGITAARLHRRFILSDLQQRAISTTLSRLVLDNQKRAVNSPDHSEHLSTVHLQREKHVHGRLRKSLTDMGIPALKYQNNQVALPAEIISRVMYWEVDPDWQGDIFHSKFQAARPWRKGDLSVSMILPKKRGTICVRIILVNGDQLQEIL